METTRALVMIVTAIFRALRYRTGKDFADVGRVSYGTAVLLEKFRCEVFTSELDARQPIALRFDDRERIRVAECYTHAERPDRWADDLRDRINILKDTDGDSRVDKRDVFRDESVHLTSIAKLMGACTRVVRQICFTSRMPTATICPTANRKWFWLDSKRTLRATTLPTA
ncbi:DUF7133 domain-containing protein [Rubripirellula reticaptiva]|uniref:DUF7133 domain-containing protein n=1 Tax=Rubripirellula reticaptiva TaxID=2528013 RepID=A0A5C6EXM9_9BACT|nr:hypothetical protein [Rubripirellula reticaptiva]TWU51971.1 hypothetical protein Poly59_35680 [Rubripirellula reticaptiva]